MNPVHIDEFREHTGPTFTVSEETLEIHTFERIFGEELFAYISDKTNRKAHAKLGHDEQHLQHWEDVTPSEFRAYFGVLLVMGITNLQEIHIYWSSDPFYGNEGVKKIFMKSRFKDIGCYLHFSDSSKEPKKGEPGYDRLFKVRHAMEYLKKKFQQLYSPGKTYL